MQVERVVRPYYAAQGVAVALWWLGLLAWPPLRAWFVVEGLSWPLFASMALPDALVLALGSLAAAREPAAWLRLVLLGAVAWATLLAWAWSFTTGSGHLGSLLMGLLLVCNLSVTGELALFRTAAEASVWRHRLATLAQVVPFWTTFLAILPWCIDGLDPWGWDARATTRAAGIAVFAAASGVGLWSAWTMATLGAGTPLPVACPRRLVIRGPYAFVRNPMALAGMAQGAGVGLALGSPLVLVYALAGAVAWHTVARPPEEADLSRRFGEDYERYRARVRLWWPIPRSLSRNDSS